MRVIAEIRYGLRRLTRTPLLTVVLVATLAIVIGAASSVAGIIDRLVLHPFP